MLFLGDEEGDLTPLRGGELGLVDALEVGLEAGGGERGGEHGGSGWGGDAQLAAGVLVEPRRGRLVLFSGGGENYHAPLPVAQGRRTSFQVWFGCDCDV